MKKHFRILLDPAHRGWTLSFLVAAVILIVAANLIGIADNLPGIALLYAGMILLFLTLVHPWRKPSSYGTLAGICTGIIALISLLIYIVTTFFMNQVEQMAHPGEENYWEAFVMIFTLFICLPGILVGLFGSIIMAFRKH